MGDNEVGRLMSDTDSQISARRCDKCEFWVLEKHSPDHHPDDREGRCHRYAPRPTIGYWHSEVMSFLSLIAWQFATDEQTATDFKNWEEAVYEPSSWPATTGADWCGEFLKKQG
jgi:hypothetical protein